MKHTPNKKLQRVTHLRIIQLYFMGKMLYSLGICSTTINTMTAEEIKKMDILETNIRLIQALGFHGSHTGKWMKIFDIYYPILFLLLSLFNVLSTVVETFRQKDTSLIVEGTVCILLFIKSCIRVATLVKNKKSFVDIFKLFEENIFNNYETLTSSQRRLVIVDLNKSAKLVHFIWLVNLLFNSTTLLSLLPPSEEELEYINSVSAPEWKSPTSYAAPMKLARHPSIVMRIWYLIYCDFLIIIPSILLFSYYCLLLSYLSTLFSLLANSLKYSVQNVEKMSLSTSSSADEICLDVIDRHARNELQGTPSTRNKNHVLNMKSYNAHHQGKRNYDREYLAYLKGCIKQHHTLIKAFEMMDKSMKPVIVADTIITGLYLATLGFAILVSEKNEYAVQYGAFLIFTTGELGIFCWVATSFSTQTELVGLSAYYCEWHTLPPAIQRQLGMIIMRCQRPLRISVGPFGYFTLELYASILNSSYSYFAILKEFI